ncbi:MAG: glycoside hydrolase family 9 protein, partial [Tepidisphaeraceae bacterium]
DACDVRKWVSATIYGMIGLARVLQLDAQHQLDRAAFLDELRWGNRYFLAMQEPAGYVMDWCGGDTGNHFTDNRPNTGDDRRIRTAACEQPAQYQFILAQALAAEAFRSTMPEAANHCLAAARRCLSWCEGQRRDRAMTHAAAVSAILALYRTTSDTRLLPMIDKHLTLLIELQALGTAKQPGGYFFRDSSRAEPLRDISDGNLPLIALSEAVLAFPEHPDAARRRAALGKHVDHLAEMSRRGAFDTIPFGLYVNADPGGDRRYGDAWYRWFMKPGHDQQNDDWWVGINAHLASNGVGLMLASQALGDASLTAIAQRQFDWILGSNPFDCSTVTGAGRNQPALFRTSEFTPNTPLLVGGVMNGIGGTPMDTPLLASGNYNTCEYWTPMVGYFGWLGALLQSI